MRLLTLSLLASFFWFGCSFKGLDHDGKVWPCAIGWIAEPGEVCRLPPEAGVDAARPEDAARDARLDVRFDSGRTDTAVPTDSGATDALSDAGDDAVDAVDAGPEVPCPPGLLFCDDFEGTPTSRWVRDDGRTSEVVSRFDGGRSYSGSLALRAEVLRPTTEPFGPVFYRDFPTPFRSTTIYLRAFVYLETATYLDLNLFGFARIAPRGGHLDVKVNDDHLGVFTLAGGGSLTNSAGRFPQNEWVCVSVQIDVRNPGRVQASAGAATVNHSANTEPPAGLERLYVGPFWAREGHQPAVYWLDDMALDDEPLPCE